ncbi:hypothetical protein BDZ45DRAFT_809619 [Acephala macrosclerotiorum]|nr:hypothetical protein BDZ45DRAFT_809619 [Acephala macrosclerotiorum]
MVLRPNRPNLNRNDEANDIRYGFVVTNELNRQVQPSHCDLAKLVRGLEMYGGDQKDRIDLYGDEVFKSFVRKNIVKEMVFCERSHQHTSCINITYARSPSFLVSDILPLPRLPKDDLTKAGNYVLVVEASITHLRTDETEWSLSYQGT